MGGQQERKEKLEGSSDARQARGTGHMHGPQSSRYGLAPSNAQRRHMDLSLPKSQTDDDDGMNAPWQLINLQTNPLLCVSWMYRGLMKSVTRCLTRPWEDCVVKPRSP